jgi:uncharacterized protein YjbI with pentapeptide repeats
LSVQAFQVQPKENKEKLWEVFNNFPFNYDPQFFFKIDSDFKNQIVRDYKLATLSDFHLGGYLFTRENQFESTIFTECTFKDCVFSLTAFKNSSFVNCHFYNCELITNGEAYSDCYFTVYGCVDDNNFVNKVYECEGSKEVEEINIERRLLTLYFKKGSYKPRHRQLSHIKNELSNYDF